MAGRRVCQPGMFCICRSTDALRSKKSAAALLLFLLGIMCHGRRVCQPGVFCIGRRPGALRSKKSAAALLLFLLGMMCRGRGVFQPGVFCIYKRPAALRSKKICGSSSQRLLLTGDYVPWAQVVPARSVLHLQKDRCLEGAGKAALELDAACLSLTLFLFHVYSNASCGRQFQTSRRFFGLYKKQRGLRNSRSTPAGTASRPSTTIPI